MRVCPGCRTTYDESVQTCPKDGLPLLDVSPTFAALRKDGVEEPRLPPASDTAVKAGMMIGEFRVERTIAEGGMGAIYAAIHPVISKRVAVKVLNKRFAQDPKAVGRFVLEARSVNQIGHHCIVDIFSIGELDDGRNYLVMELLDGPALHQILPRVKRFRPGELVPVYEQLCDALMAAHAKGFVHRDLKPDNVIVLRRPPRPQIKILDFGIAKLRGAATDSTSENTEVGTVLGTPEYMSPEQCRGSDVDSRTDIYALGVMLYELITGRKPFTDPSPMRILTMQLRDQPIPPSRIAPIPKALEMVILRAMAKTPGERQSSAKQLYEEIRAAVPQPLPWSVDLSFHSDESPAAAPKLVPKQAEPAAPLAARPPAPRALDVPAPVSMTGVDNVAVSIEEVDDDSATMVADSPAPPPEVTKPVEHSMAELRQAAASSMPEDDVTRPVLTPEARAKNNAIAPRATAAQASGSLAGGMQHKHSFRDRAQQLRTPRKPKAPPAPLAIAGHGTGELDADQDTNVADDADERTEVASREHIPRALPDKAFETPSPRELSDMSESTLVDDEPPVAVLVSRPIQKMPPHGANAGDAVHDDRDGSSPRVSAQGARKPARRKLKRPPPPEPLASTPDETLPPTAPVPLLDRTKLGESPQQPAIKPPPTRVPPPPMGAPAPSAQSSAAPPRPRSESGPLPRAAKRSPAAPPAAASAAPAGPSAHNDIGNAATLVPGSLQAEAAMLVDRPLTEEDSAPSAMHPSSVQSPAVHAPAVHAPAVHPQSAQPAAGHPPAAVAAAGHPQSAAAHQSGAYPKLPRQAPPGALEAPPLRPPQQPRMQQTPVGGLRPISSPEPTQPARTQARKRQRRVGWAPLIIGVVAALAAVAAIVLVLLLKQS